MNITCAAALDLLKLQFPHYVDDAISSVDRLFSERKEFPIAIKELFLKKIEEQEEVWNQKHRVVLAEEIRQIEGKYDEATEARLLFDKEQELLYDEYMQRFDISPIERGLFLKNGRESFTPKRWLEMMLRSQVLSETEREELCRRIMQGDHLQFGVKPTKFPQLQQSLSFAKKVAVKFFQEGAKDLLTNEVSYEKMSCEERLLLIVKIFLDVCPALSKTKELLAELSSSVSYNGEKESEVLTWTALNEKIQDLIGGHKEMAQLAEKYPNVSVGPLYFSKEKLASEDILKATAAKAELFMANSQLFYTHLAAFIDLFSIYLKLDRNQEPEDATFTTLRQIHKVFGNIVSVSFPK